MTENFNWGGQYISPEIGYLELDAEGILCSSTEDLKLNDEWNDTFGW